MNWQAELGIVKFLKLLFFSAFGIKIAKLQTEKSEFSTAGKT